MSIIVEKNRSILGSTFEAELNDGSKEVFTLKPVSIKHWNELDSAALNQFDILLVTFSIGKERKWVEENLSPNSFCSLYDACVEVNKGFFDRLNDLQPKIMQDTLERNARLEQIQQKYARKRSSASESASVTSQTT